jgi:hypothetical protein
MIGNMAARRKQSSSTSRKFENSRETLIARNDACAHHRRQFKLDALLEVRVRCVVAAKIPINVLGPNAIVLLQEAADPERGSLHELLDADAFALQIRRRADTRVNIDPDVLMAEAPGRIDRDADKAPVSAAVECHEGRKRKFRGVECAVARPPAEGFHRHHRQKVQAYAFDRHRATPQPERTFIKPAGERDWDLHSPLIFARGFCDRKRQQLALRGRLDL